MRRGKKYLEKEKLVVRDKLHSPVEAVSLLKDLAFANFDESIEAHFNLGIDPRQSDQQIRGTLVLPHGTGKVVKILVIASGDKLSEATDAGADYVGSDDMIEKIQGGWFDFDLVLTTPDMMAKVGRLGKTLGTKGMMPNPKSGTVTVNIADAVREFKAGKVEYKNDKSGVVHVMIGKKSFLNQKLLENFYAVYDTLQKVKPPKAKGIYLKTLFLCCTMSKGISIEPLKIKWKEV